jgi:predicted NBD/HSP70 family sugar kinase
MTALPLEFPMPALVPPLDDGFRPAALATRSFLRKVDESGAGVPLVLGLERSDGSLSRFETRVLPDGHEAASASLHHVERILKFLLWQRGGWKVYVGGSASIGRHIQSLYRAGGARGFDSEMLGTKVYQKPFTVVSCAADEVPNQEERAQALGRHLDGCRIGFDLGASDLKVSAVIDGRAVYSEEIVWEPAIQSDPQYHYDYITSALRSAASKLPRLDAIGGSAAGVYVGSQPRVASLFRGIPASSFDDVRDLFLRIGTEFGVPLEVINDGEVTALAGSMSLQAGGSAGHKVLGIAMGSSEAAGYVNSEGRITGWLNELAFAPIDYSPTAPSEEWSRDRGVGARYFSQQCVFRLAPRVGIDLPVGVTKAEMLRSVQEKLEAGQPGAVHIWQSMGIYLGYAVAHYADFYDLEHVLILGRCTSGSGGGLILDSALEVLQSEFPLLADSVRIQLPDEKSRRVGQSIAAASLPALR